MGVETRTMEVALTPIYGSRDTSGGLVNLAHTTRLVSYAVAGSEPG
jgi:hypothetical protein